MSYIATEYVQLPTSLGTLILWCNGTRDDGTLSIGVRTEQEHNRSERNAPAGGWDGVAEVVTINRVDYRLHVHLSVSRDSGKVHGRDKWGHYGERGQILTRAQMFSLEHGSTSAETKAFDVVADAVEAFIVTDEGRALVRRAVFAQVNNQLDSLKREEKEAVAKLAEIRDKMRTARRTMARNAVAV